MGVPVSVPSKSVNVYVRRERMEGGGVGEVELGKLSGWMTPQDILMYLEEGDLIEFQRDVFQHWAVYVHSDCETGRHLLVHLTGGNDMNVAQLSSASLQPSAASTSAAVESLKEVESLEDSTKSVKSFITTSVRRVETAEVQCHDIFEVAGQSKCRINNRKDLEYTPYSQTEVSARAISQLGIRKYSVLFTNCEHFVKWCRYGSKSSSQTSVAKTAVMATAAVAVTGSMTAGGMVGVATFVACRVCNLIRHKISKSYGLQW